MADMTSRKQYNVQAVDKYFQFMAEALQHFQEKLNEFDTTLQSFVDDETWRGKDADMAKSMAENEEHQLIERICKLQNEMIELQDEIQEMFFYDVDRHPRANIETDVLATIQTDCSKFYLDHEAAISDVEAIDKELAAYSHYYTFPDLDFSKTRDSFQILCGRGETDEGYINECLKKLLDFDEAAALHILERKLDVEIIELQKALEAHLKIPRDDFNYSDMNRLENSYRKLLDVGPKATEIETFLDKSDKDFTEEDAKIIANYYIEAVKNKDASTVSLIVNSLTVEQYARISEDGKTEYTYIMWMDQYKSQMIAEQMLDEDGGNQKKTDEAYVSFNDLKNTHYMLEGTTRPTSTIEVQTTDSGLLVLWDFNYNATNRKDRVERMIFDPSLIQGTTDRERAESRYETINKVSGHEELRMHYKALKDESQLADYSSVKNKRDFKANSAYDANYTYPNDTKSFFGTHEKKDFTYDFINSDDPRAYYLRAKGGRELNLPEEYESLLHMTEEEKQIYNYLHHSSKEDADRYLELLNLSLKTRVADERFEKIKDNAVLETLSGYGSGVIQVAENIENRLGLNDDADGVPLVSENEVYSSMVQSDLADKGVGWEMAYGLTYGAGQATPGIVISAATGGGAGSVIATTGLYSVSAGGSARTEALRNGYTEEEAGKYANMTTVEEAAKILAMGYVTKTIGGTAGTVKFDTIGQSTSAKIITGIEIGGANATIEAIDEALIKPQIGYNALHDPDKLNVDGKEVLKNAAIAGAASFVAYEGEHVLHKAASTDKVEPAIEKHTVADKKEITLKNVGGEGELKNVNKDWNVAEYAKIEESILYKEVVNSASDGHMMGEVKLDTPELPSPPKGGTLHETDIEINNTVSKVKISHEGETGQNRTTNTRNTENTTNGNVGSDNNSSRIALPGDIDFVGPINSGGWTLAPNGEGAHLVERSNVRGRPDLTCFDMADTPRYYPYGSPESAGQAHIRLHEATRNEGIKLRGGNPNMSDTELLEHYLNAYCNSDLNGIRGDLRTPNGSYIIAKNVTPAEAFEALMEWYNNN